MDGNIWVAVWHHRHGEDIYVFQGTDAPTEQAVIDRINLDSEFEPDDEEYIDICGPYSNDIIRDYATDIATNAD